MIGVAASGVIFGITRYFAGGKPRTLNKEYEEATNEYFKVSTSIITAASEAVCLTTPPTGEQDRAHQRRRQRRLQGSRTGAEPARGQGVETLSTRVPRPTRFFLEHSERVERALQNHRLPNGGSVCILRRACRGHVQSFYHQLILRDFYAFEKML